MSANREFKITDAKGGAAFGVRLITQSESSEVVGWQDNNMLKVRVKAAAADSAAMQSELLDLLAHGLNIPVRQIEIVAVDPKEKNRMLVSVSGMSTEAIESKFVHLD